MWNKLEYDGLHSSPNEQCLYLLYSLKQTVEWLMSSCSSNVWNIYGGLSRLCTIIEKILAHGLRSEEGAQKYWNFFCGLHWLKPTIAPPFYFCEKRENSAIHQESIKSHMWLKKSLQEHTLSYQLQALISNTDHLLSYYYEEAFLCDKTCTKVLLTCLKAIENNQPSLLADLDPSLGAVSQLYNSFKSSKSSLKSEMSEETSSSFRGAGHTDAFYRNVNDKTLLVGTETNCSQNSSNCKTPGSTRKGICKQNKFPNQMRSLRNFQRQKGRSSLKFQAEKLSRANNSELNSKKFCDNFLSDNTVHGEKNLPQVDVSSDILIENVFSKANTDTCVNSTFPCEQNGLINKYRIRCKGQRSLSYPGMSSEIFRQCHRSNSLTCVYDTCNKVKCLTLRDFMPQHTQTRQCKNLLSESRSNITGNFNLCPDSQSCKVFISSNNKNISNIVESTSQDSISSLFTPEANITDICSKKQDAGKGCEWKAQHSRSKSDISCSSHSKLSIENIDECSEASPLSSSLPNSLNDQGQKKKSILEGSHIVVPTECFFPRPQQGQSLTSFLSSNDFNICAELDRENAHFCISEALISAIEHIKCNQSLNNVEEEEESDEEIRKLKQRIRIRRRERQHEKAVKSIILLSDGKTDTATSQSASSPMSSSHSSDFQTDTDGTEDDVEDLELSDPAESNLSHVKENGLSLSMASLYSDADIQKFTFTSVPHPVDAEDKRYVLDSNGIHLSAESVALSLLKRFSEKQLPKASELEWLVSEQDAPQRLLPLPDSWPVSPDTVEEEYNLTKTRLRGNLEWAPPRAQIIFNIHPDPKRKEIIDKQKYRCAGCGMKIERNYIDRFRYCDYLGKLFCQCCHNNSLAYIPGRILRKWDFKKYYVSKFSCDLLDQMFGDPLFNIMDINNYLYRKVRQLDMSREYRIQLFYLKDFIRTCRKAERLHEELEQQPTHITNEPHLYSLYDLIQVKNGDLPKRLYQLSMKCVSHVMQCVLCQAKGFICEICNNDGNIIFPFQLAKVFHCHACGSCFHKSCYSSGICPKCIRIEERKKKLQEQKFVLSSEEEP